MPIVAFANADGGVIAIGVSDKTRKIEGVDQHTEKLNELLRVPFDFCNPSVPVTCSYLPCTDKDGNENRILVMEIPASSSLHTNQADEAFMRVGDKSWKLTFDERVQLMYDKGERYYEDTAVYGATINDIDMDAVADYAKLVGYARSPLQYLRENNGFVRTNKKAAIKREQSDARISSAEREQEANGANVPSFRTDEFILKITVPKVTEKVSEKVTVNDGDVTQKVTVTRQGLLEKLIERASINGDKLTENRIAILGLMIDNPYISKIELAKIVGISANSIMRNIDYMRGKYLRRVGPDKGGFWEIIEAQ